MLAARHDDDDESEINKLLSPDSKEVAYTISGYITNKKINFQCEIYYLMIVGNDSDKATDKEYFDLLLEEVLLFHLDKWRSLFVLVLQ